MPPVILTLLQALFLLLLYVFVARAVRAVVRDLSPAGATPARGRLRAPKAKAERTGRRGGGGGGGTRRGGAGRDRARREPAEIVVHLPGGAPRVIRLDEHPEGAGVTFGRAADVTVRIDDPYVSDRHARIYRTEQGWVLADLGSTNGTYRNNSKVAGPTRLVAGDHVAIGKTVVEVRH